MLTCSGFAGGVVNADFELTDKNGQPVAWELPAGSGWHVVEREGINGTRALCFDREKMSPERKRGIPRQWVEIDRSKKYLMEAWVRTVGVSGGGASICIECYNKDGGVFYGKYSRDLINGTTDGWVKVSDVTGAGQFPDTAVKLALCVFAKGIPSGKIYFDNVRLVPYEEVRAKVAGLISDIYRDTADTGKVTFRGVLNLSDADFTNGVPMAMFRFPDADGKSVTRRADRVTKDEAALTLDVAELAIGTNVVECVIDDATGAHLGRAKTNFVRTSEPVRRRVSIDRHNRTLVDGKPFFPLGAYINHIDWKGETNFSIYCQAPFNCVLPYALPQNRECMDLCQKTNLMVIASIYHVWAGSRGSWVATEADEQPFLEKAVSDYADHPALLAWYLCDELPAAMIPRMVKRVELMSKLDPDHPTYACICQVDEIRDYLKGFDVVGSDPYPIGREQIKAHPISMAGEWTRKTRQGTYGTRAMWQTPQLFDWDWFCKAGNPKFPTYDEFLNMSYQCIAEGANGLVYYSFSTMLKNDTKFAEHWPYICRAIREIAANIPVFLLEPGPVATASASGLSVRTWRDGKTTWVLAVNATRQPLTAKVSLDKAVGVVEKTALGPTPKALDNGKVLVFDFSALGRSLVSLGEGVQEPRNL